MSLVSAQPPGPSSAPDPSEKPPSDSTPASSPSPRKRARRRTAPARPTPAAPSAGIPQDTPPDLIWSDPAGPPKLQGATLLLALSGWMDGGLVSTGTVRQIMEGRVLTEVARIRPGGPNGGYYIENFPGSMEIASVFRPEVKYKGGVITSFEATVNVFHADPQHGMLFFTGKEPNVNWQGFADCIYTVVRACGVSRILFMGSFGGMVPHTREPRLYGSVSSRKLLPLLSRYGLRPSDYQGPASFASYLLYLAPRLGVEMISIAAEIPGYLQGHNPVSIEAVTRRLAALLELDTRGGVDLAALRRESTEWELKVSEFVEKDKELRKRVRELEEEYDNALIADQT